MFLSEGLALAFFLRVGRSCLQQLLLYLNTIVEAHECSNSVDVIYLDLRKAFDSVSYLKLLHKLKFYGITGQLLRWFKSYLFNRWQCVRINQSISQLLSVLSGLPQGSILGPLLFILYTNDLPGCLSTTTSFSFGDDTKILLKIQASEDERLMQKDI